MIIDYFVLFIGIAIVGMLVGIGIASAVAYLIDKIQGRY